MKKMCDSLRRSASAMTLLIALFFPLLSIAQNTVRVFNIEGRVQYSSNGQTWETLDGQHVIKDYAIIRLSPGATACFAREKAVAVIDNGMYNGKKVKELPFKPTDGVGSGIWNVFVHMIVSNHKEGGVGTTTRKGVNCSPILPADYEVLTDDNVAFRWESDGHCKMWLREKSNSGPKPICENIRVSGTTVLLKDIRTCSGLSTLDRSKKYYWNVLSDYDNNKDSYFSEFRFARTSELAEINNELRALNEYRNVGTGALFHLMKAACYESHQMYTKAYDCYVDAMNASTSSELAEDALNDFLAKLRKMNAGMKQ